MLGKINGYIILPFISILLLLQGCINFSFDNNYFSFETDMEGWLEAMGPLLKQLHLHDNTGANDDHLAIGAGRIDFDRLFAHIEAKGLRPIVTLEAHEEKAIWQSLEVLSQSEPFRRIVQAG